MNALTRPTRLAITLSTVALAVLLAVLPMSAPPQVQVAWIVAALAAAWALAWATDWIDRTIRKHRRHLPMPMLIRTDRTLTVGVVAVCEGSSGKGAGGGE